MKTAITAADVTRIHHRTAAEVRAAIEAEADRRDLGDFWDVLAAASAYLAILEQQEAADDQRTAELLAYFSK